jgi:hypothetical protein
MPLILLHRRMLRAQARRPAERRRRQQPEGARAPNPNGHPPQLPIVHNGMAQNPRARLRPTSNPMEQRRPSARCDKEPNLPQLHSGSTHGHILDLRATFHDRRDLRSRSRRAKHIAPTQTSLHVDRARRPTAEIGLVGRAAVRHSSLDPFPRTCIADQALRYKPGLPQLLRPRRFRRTQCWNCHPRLRQRDIYLGAESRMPDSEYQSRSFRYLPDDARAKTRSLVPPGSEPLDPSGSGKKRLSAMRGEARCRPYAAHLATLARPRADLQW